MTDAAEFEAFVREYQDMVFATAVRLLGNPSEAEDVAQTVFLRAFERFGTAGPGPAAPGWLKTVATNLCLNHLSRYRNRWRFFSELSRDRDDEAASPFEAILAGGSSPAEDLEAADRQALVEQALQGLPHHQRVPLVLYHFEQKNYQEIAGLLGVSLGKLKTDMHRGRLALKRYLERHAAR
ncbi:MAG: RNA polymerase sigma factor [Acidobacteria bacterium]|nr:RNA polymerase sigma factor [Acidobacteriota bacterium]